MVNALFPIGKTQWAKWSDEQKTAFNEARAAGVPHLDAIAEVNAGKTQPTKPVEEVVKQPVKEDVAVTPVVAVAKTVVKATKKKGK